MRTLRLIVLTALAMTAAATPATAAPWRGWSLYDGKAAVEGGTGTHSARLTSIVLPESFKVKKRATRLTFGPFASCRSTGVISMKLVRSTRVAGHPAGGRLRDDPRIRLLIPQAVAAVRRMRAS